MFRARTEKSNRTGFVRSIDGTQEGGNDRSSDSLGSRWSYRMTGTPPVYFAIIPKELIRSWLGNLPFKPSKPDDRHWGNQMNEKRLRTMEHSEMRKRVPRIVNIESRPDGTRRDVELLRVQIYFGIVDRRKEIPTRRTYSSECRRGKQTTKLAFLVSNHPQ